MENITSEPVRAKIGIKFKPLLIPPWTHPSSDRERGGNTPGGVSGPPQVIFKARTPPTLRVAPLQQQSSSSQFPLPLVRTFIYSPSRINKGNHREGWRLLSGSLGWCQCCAEGMSHPSLEEGGTFALIPPHCPSSPRLSPSLSPHD